MLTLSKTTGRLARNLGLAAGLAVSCAGLSVTAQAEAASTADVEAVIAQAQASFARARELGHAWSVTPQYLETARAELAQNHTEQALQAAQRALLTAEQALEQARVEQTAWQARVPQLD